MTSPHDATLERFEAPWSHRTTTVYELTLFVSGASDLAARAIANARRLCDAPSRRPLPPRRSSTSTRTPAALAQRTTCWPRRRWSRASRSRCAGSSAICRRPTRCSPALDLPSVARPLELTGCSRPDARPGAHRSPTSAAFARHDARRAPEIADAAICRRRSPTRCCGWPRPRTRCAPSAPARSTRSSSPTAVTAGACSRCRRPIGRTGCSSRTCVTARPRSRRAGSSCTPIGGSPSCLAVPSESIVGSPLAMFVAGGRPVRAGRDRAARTGLGATSSSTSSTAAARRSRCWSASRRSTSTATTSPA